MINIIEYIVAIFGACVCACFILVSAFFLLLNYIAGTPETRRYPTNRRTVKLSWWTLIGSVICFVTLVLLANLVWHL